MKYYFLTNLKDISSFFLQILWVNFKYIMSKKTWDILLLSPYYTEEYTFQNTAENAIEDIIQDTIEVIIKDTVECVDDIIKDTIENVKDTVEGTIHIESEDTIENIIHIDSTTNESISKNANVIPEQDGVKKIDVIPVNENTTFFTLRSNIPKKHNCCFRLWKSLKLFR
jgi:CRISPR/Cas system CSM-associated protein Csm4 (group 5 of RAMP superfamily)